MTTNSYMMSADEVRKELDCSKSYAYKLIKSMNEELSAKGFVTRAGRVPRPFYEEKLYGYKAVAN